MQNDLKILFLYSLMMQSLLVQTRNFYSFVLFSLVNAANAPLVENIVFIFGNDRMVYV